MSKYYVPPEIDSQECAEITSAIDSIIEKLNEIGEIKVSVTTGRYLQVSRTLDKITRARRLLDECVYTINYDLKSLTEREKEE